MLHSLASAYTHRDCFSFLSKAVVHPLRTSHKWRPTETTQPALNVSDAEHLHTKFLTQLLMKSQRRRREKHLNDPTQNEFMAMKRHWTVLSFSVCWRSLYVKILEHTDITQDKHINAQCPIGLFNLTSAPDFPYETEVTHYYCLNMKDPLARDNAPLFVCLSWYLALKWHFKNSSGLKYTTTRWSYELGMSLCTSCSAACTELNPGKHWKVKLPNTFALPALNP